MSIGLITLLAAEVDLQAARALRSSLVRLGFEVRLSHAPIGPSDGTILLCSEESWKEFARGDALRAADSGSLHIVGLHNGTPLSSADLPHDFLIQISREDFDPDQVAAALQAELRSDVISSVHLPKGLSHILAASTAALFLVSAGLGAAYWHQGTQIDRLSLQVERSAQFSDAMLLYMAENLPDAVQPIVLEDLGERAIALFEADDERALSDDALTQRARILHFIAEARSVNGNVDGADEAYQLAHQLTGDALARAPENEDRRFAHSQSAFWVGAGAYRRGRLEEAETAFRTYSDLALGLSAEFPGNPVYQGEIGHAAVNLAAIDIERGHTESAVARLEFAVERFRSVHADIRNVSISDIANALAWLADARYELGQFEGAAEAYRQGSEIYQARLENHPNDARAAMELANTLHRTGLALAVSGRHDEASPYFESGLDYISRARRAVPDNVQARTIYTSLVSSRAAELRRNGQLINAKLLIDNARSRLIEDETGASDERFGMMARLSMQSARISLAFGEFERAQLEVASAIRDLERHTERGHSREQTTLAEAQLLMAEIFEALGHPGEARRSVRQASEALADTQARDWHVASLQTRIKWLNGQQGEARREADALSAVGYAEADFVDFWRGVNDADIVEIQSEQERIDG